MIASCADGLTSRLLRAAAAVTAEAREPGPPDVEARRHVDLRAEETLRRNELGSFFGDHYMGPSMNGFRRIPATGSNGGFDYSLRGVRLRRGNGIGVCSS
jgi:hypothetical protein